MDGERRVLQERVESVAFGGAGSRRRNGSDVVRMNSMKATAMQACTPSTLRRQRQGQPRPKVATAAPNSARISTHSTMEPSWFPQTPEIL